jgi:hypothetical protein
MPACANRYAHLLKALGGPGYDHDAPIGLDYILDTNGLDDALWALRATVEDSTVFSWLLACEYAERTLPIWERVYPDDMRPRRCIDVARRYVLGEATAKEMDEAAQAGEAAEAAAAEAAAGAVRATAVRATAAEAAEVAVAAAVRVAAAAAAVAAAAEHLEQRRVLRERLVSGYGSS